MLVELNKIVGGGLNNTLTESMIDAPQALVTVTMYVVGCVGVAKKAPGPVTCHDAEK